MYTHVKQCYKIPENVVDYTISSSEKNLHVILGAVQERAILLQGAVNGFLEIMALAFFL